VNKDNKLTKEEQDKIFKLKLEMTHQRITKEAISLNQLKKELCIVDLEKKK
jgi:hypothetical protein